MSGGEAAVEAARRYMCVVCMYIYDPAVGDPEAGIPPGTAFADLPDTWVCPACRAKKKAFRPMKT
ncbi:rubredoxin [Novispirillum sp. DQ9]|uniref:rubredoxin n=1 Tax=Novispirillum sp. DQ9 TaxID=3398612 RepID=UPI003C7CEDB4